MTVYRPVEEKWMRDLPVECTCDMAWRGRGMVDSRCYYHELVFAVMDLRDQGWTVELPQDSTEAMPQPVQGGVAESSTPAPPVVVQTGTFPMHEGGK